MTVAGGRLRSLGMTYPAHQVLGPRHQFTGVERLDHIVVSAALEADDTVDVVVAPGNEDDADF
ncbi:hypothetical protein D3C85_1858900 [compost metagenome]